MAKNIRWGIVVVLVLGPAGLANWLAVADYSSRRHTLSNLTETTSSDLSGQLASVSTPLESVAAASEAYGKLPLSFEANQGQTDSGVQFLARGPGYGLFLTSGEAVLALRKQDAVSSGRAANPFSEISEVRNAEFAGSPSAVVRMTLVGASSAPQAAGMDELPGKSHYFHGNDPRKWHTNVSNYAKVEYKAVYPGIDLVYYGTGRQLEYDFVVAPGADSSRIKLRFAGVRDVSIDADGELLLRAADGDLRQHKPIIYQETSGHRQEIDGRYVINSGGEIGFEVARYDTSRPLVIDPVLVYSTYLGGSDWDEGYGIAVDGAGNAYVTGNATSLDFPIAPGAFQPTHAGSRDVFVTKLDSGGSALVYSTYFGGSQDDSGVGIAVDGTGRAYVTGVTYSPDFPTTLGALQADDQAFGDAFVVKLNRRGSALVYSTYLGGSSSDQGRDIAVDSAGNAYVTGETYLLGFPTTPDAFQPANAGSTDAFVAKLNRRGSALVYSTYLGGSGIDDAVAIAVDGVGNAYVTGRTMSPDFPTTLGAVQAAQAPPGAFPTSDAFVTKLSRRGSTLVYSTYLGGSGSDAGNGIAVDDAGRAYVVGSTSSVDFPTTPLALQPVYGGSGDAFVTKLTRRGSTLVYSTYLGGSTLDGGRGIAVDGAGRAYVTGTTFLPDSPPDAIQPTHGIPGGANDAFATKLNRRGSALVYSVHFGGSNDDQSTSIALDRAGNAYVAGRTISLDFPISPSAFQPAHAGYIDAFITKISTADDDHDDDEGDDTKEDPDD